MLRPAHAFLPALVFAASLVLVGCFGGGGSPQNLSRPGPVRTATPPAKLPDPIMLGESQAGGGASQTSGAGGDSYVIKSGDTLYGIASALGVPGDQQASWVAETLRLNGIQDTTNLHTGDTIRLPKLQATVQPAATAKVSQTAPAAQSTSAPAATATSAPTASSAPTATRVTGGAGTYTVQSGDTPYIIAQKLGVPQSQWAAWSNELVSLNGIDPNNLHVGDVLKLPSDTPGQ